MAQQHDIQRPTLPERHETFKTFMAQLAWSNALVNKLQRAYDNTEDSNVRDALQMIHDARRLAEQEFWSAEDEYRAQEIAEFWKSPGKWADSVRDWMIHYRDKELS